MRRLKILHVVGNLAPGGVETWLLHTARRIDQRQFQFDFLTLFAEPQLYDAEVRDLGGAVVHCPGYRRPWQFADNFRRLVGQHGPYDIVHCHLQEFSGLVMALAAAVNIPVRIVHSHSDPLQRWAVAALPRRLYMRGMQLLMRRYATTGLAVSSEAARLFVDAVSGRAVQWLAHPCGIDLRLFAADYDRAATRAELGIAPQQLVIGHVGRFVALKNHGLLLELLAALLADGDDARLLLVGDGPERAATERAVSTHGLTGRVTFAGTRQDVARMLAAMDILVLPSHYEGLGLAAVEAQAAGLPCLLSDRVPAAATLAPALVRRIALSAPAAAWAMAVRALLEEPLPPRELALEQVRRSGFAIEQSVAGLAALYRAEANHAGIA